MNKIYFFITLTFVWVCIIQAAVPITQMWVKSIVCEKDLPYFDCGFRIKRISKTAQEVLGYVDLKLPVADDKSLHINMSYVDYTGIWKAIGSRDFDKLCSRSLPWKTSVKRYLPDVELSCPIKPGNYTVGPKIIHRYRKDWADDLKFWIPPMFIEADVWKGILTYYFTSDPSRVIGQLTFEVRLFNEFMSQ